MAGHVLRTPILPAPPLSALTGADVYVKYENLQVTNSFKERGACAKLAALGAAERRRGVIAMSAGNHAQAVAYHARRLAIPATIVMPVTTPFVKVKATEALGATVVLHGETVADAQARAAAIADERDLVWVHPYDDAHIIAGQGTIALEMLRGRAGARCSGHADRRRRAHCRQCRRGACHQARDRDRRRRMRALSVDVECDPWRHQAVRRRDAGRRHRGEQRRRIDAADRARARARHYPGRRAADRARRQCVPDPAKDHGGRRRRRRACRDAGRSRSALPAARSG